MCLKGDIKNLEVACGRLVIRRQIELTGMAFDAYSEELKGGPVSFAEIIDRGLITDEMRQSFYNSERYKKGVDDMRNFINYLKEFE